MKKRLLAILLSAMLCITSLAVYADATEDAEAVAAPDELYLETLDILNGLDIFGGDAGYFENENIKRSELAEIVYAMVGTVDMSQKGQRHYIDVKESHPSYKEIETVSHLKLMGGHGNNMFEPDEFATYNEVIKTMVCAINFQKYAEVKGGYPTGYLVAANRQEILDSVDFNSTSEYITGRDFSVIVLNTLKAGMLKEASYSEDGERLVETGTNLLLEKHNIIEVKDVLEANGMTSISGDMVDDYDYVVIGDTKYKCDCNATMLGYKVAAYVEDTNNDKVYDTVKYIRALSDENKALIINADDIISYGSYQYNYGYNKRVSISMDTAVIYNGRRMVLYNENLMVPQNGYVELVSYDGDSTYDVLFIHDQQTIFVDKVTAANGFAADYYDSNNCLRVDTEDETVDLKIYKGEDEATFLQIVKGAVLTVETSQDGKCVRVFISTDKVDGTLEAAGENVVSIDGVEYYAHNAFLSSPETKIGEAGSYALDINGRIAGKMAVATDGWVYGIVLATGTKGTLDKQVQVKIFTQNNEEIAYHFAEKVVLDGVRVDEIDETTGGDNAILAAINSSKDPYCQRIPVDETDDSANVEKREELPIAVRIKLNDNNEISHIDTLHSNEHGGFSSYDIMSDKLAVMTSKASGNYNASAYTFMGNTAIAGNTAIIRINPTLTGNIEDDYKVITRSGMESNKSYTFESFTAKDAALTPQLLFSYFAGSGSDGIDDRAKFMVVESVVQALDEEGNECYAVYGLYNDLKQQILFRDDIAPTEIASGDIIRFGINNSNKIIAYDVVYCAKTGLLGNGLTSNSSGGGAGSIGADYYVGLGDVWAVDSGYAVYTQDYEFNGTTDLTIRPEGSTIVSIGSAPVYIYEKLDNGKIDVRVGKADDIIGYTTDNANPSKILVNTRWCVVNQVYIIK